MPLWGMVRSTNRNLTSACLKSITSCCGTHPSKNRRVAQPNGPDSLASPSSTPSYPHTQPPPAAHTCAESKWRPPTVALLAVTAMLADAAPARADEVDSALDSLAGVIQGAGSFIKAGVSAAGTAASLAKQGIDIAAPIVKQGVDAATPIVKSAVKAGVDAAAPVVSRRCC
eukprot:365687-Chlamydomonas_euryale.AAC.16